jgi:hypothetical protein
MRPWVAARALGGGVAAWAAFASGASPALLAFVWLAASAAVRLPGLGAPWTSEEPRRRDRAARGLFLFVVRTLWLWSVCVGGPLASVAGAFLVRGFLALLGSAGLGPDALRRLRPADLAGALAQLAFLVALSLGRSPPAPLAIGVATLAAAAAALRRVGVGAARPDARDAAVARLWGAALAAAAFFLAPERPGCCYLALALFAAASAARAALGRFRGGRPEGPPAKDRGALRGLAVAVLGWPFEPPWAEACAVVACAADYAVASGAPSALEAPDERASFAGKPAFEPGPDRDQGPDRVRGQGQDPTPDPDPDPTPNPNRFDFSTSRILGLGDGAV